MPPQISENLSRISSSSSQLNQLAKEATEQIRALDAYLNTLDIGMEVFVDVKGASGREQNDRNFVRFASYSLGYGRDDDGKFGLVIRAYALRTDAEGNTVLDPEPNPYSGENDPLHDLVWTRRLDSVRRDLRIAAVADLSSLVEKMAKDIEATSENLRHSLAETRAATEELKAALSKPADLPPSLSLKEFAEAAARVPRSTR